MNLESEAQDMDIHEYNLINLYYTFSLTIPKIPLAMKTVTLICFILIASLACNKDKTSSEVPAGYSKGVIIYADVRACPSPCCGGWYIRINNDTLHMYNTPEKSSFDFSHISFPLNVILKWEKTDIGCSGNEIIVHDIRKE